MKKFTLLYVLAFTLAALPCFAQQPAAQPAAKKADNAATSDKILYSLGYLLGNNLKEQLVLNGDDDFKAISQGLRDSLLNRNSQTDLETYKPLIAKKYQDDAAKMAEKRKTAQNKFLDDVKKDPKSKVLSNGAVIQISKKGSGKSPKATDTVKVHYEGTLPDGTVFDSSVKRGTPAEFPLNGVISCWTIGLQEMQVGAKAKLFCPADTAYGDRQAGSIPPGSLLVFDVELLDVTE